MADLDDFFAKKDRKKSKSVKKFTTADDMAKKLDDPKQKVDVRPKKERTAQEGDESGRGAEEEEWKEYEEPVKDYTGLKIHVLQGGNGSTESGRDSAAEDSTSEGGKVKGPWNKPEESTPAPPAPPVVVEEVKSGAYVAPSRLRAVEPPRRTQTKHAPDIHSDDSFPVLGAAKRGAWGAAPAPPARPTRQPLALGNRFHALRDDS